MITSKELYKLYLKEDKKALGIKSNHAILNKNSMIWLTDPIYKYQKLLRKLEYLENTLTEGKKRYLYLYLLYLRKKFQKKSIDLGITIPLNVFGYGLCILHYGSIVVSRHARIGNYCTINSGVNICGVENQGPYIGDKFYIGPGAKIIKPVKVGNNVSLGANSVLNKDYMEDNIVLAGIPAKIIKRL